MNTSSRRLWMLVVVAVLVVSGHSWEVCGQELRYQPVSTTGVGTIIDNSGTEGVPSEIILEAPGCQVTFELKVRGWGLAPGSPLLGAYQATSDNPASYENGIGEPLSTWDWPAIDGCFIDYTRPDYVYAGLTPLTGPWDDCELGSTCMGAFPTDPGTTLYGGTYIVDVPIGAKGTYEIQMMADTARTFMNDDIAQLIPGLVRTSALLTVVTGRCCYDTGSGGGCADGVIETECAALAEGGMYAFYTDGTTCATHSCEPCTTCNDWNACTDDWCNPETGWCHFDPTYEVGTECCDPDNGTVTLIDDGIECTDDVCDPLTGVVTHNARMLGAYCDDGNPCTVDDECDGTATGGACAGGLPADEMIACPGGDVDCPDDWICELDPAEMMYGYCVCSFEVEAPVAAGAPDDVPTNRYVSFVPQNAGTPVAFEVVLTSSELFPDSVGAVGWAGAPVETESGDFASSVVSYPVVRLWPEGVIQLRGCMIVPGSAYEVRATLAGAGTSDFIELTSTAIPAPKYWCDVVGSFTGGSWSAPNGIVSMDDVMAAVQVFQRNPSAPRWSWSDVDPEVPNAVVNMTDIMRIGQGFRGLAYPFSAPADCP